MYGEKKYVWFLLIDQVLIIRSLDDLDGLLHSQGTWHWIKSIFAVLFGLVVLLKVIHLYASIRKLEVIVGPLKATEFWEFATIENLVKFIEEKKCDTIDSNSAARFLPQI